MAVNPVQFLVASNASILDGTKTITISGGVNASRVFSGTAVFLGGADNPAEAVSGTAPDGSGISTITLRNNWTQGDVSNQSLVAFNTNEGLAEAISNVREIVSNASALEDLATEGLVKRIDDNNYEVVSITSLGESLVGANDAGTARSVLGLGSAATEDVTTSRTDTDGSRVMRVFDFGLGQRVAQKYPSNDLDDATVPAGFYRVVNNAPDNGSRPDGFSVFGTVLIQTYAVDTKVQIYTDIVNQKMAFRSFSATNSTPWQEIYHSGNSVNPLDYGIGSDAAVPVDDWNTPREAGFYRGSTSTTTNAPLSISQHFTGIRLPSFNTNNGGLLVCSTNNRWFVNTHSENALTGWNELYHSGNSVNPLDYGIGGVNKLPNASSLQGEYENGFYYIPNATSRPSANASNWYLRVENVLNNPDFRKYTASPVNPINGSAAEYTCIKSDGTFTNWERNFTEGNTNFNEFGGLSANDVVAQGAALNNNFVIFYLPINSKTAPTGITVEGTFKVTTPLNNLSIKSGVTPQLLGLSSNKVACIGFTSLSASGLSEGDALELVTESSTSKITVNF